jgi:Kef-type K+ transport system membrane component KefB
MLQFIYLHGALDFSFPLKNPVLIFALILFIILFAPIILNKFKIPYLIGLILAGVVIGPNGLNVLLRDSAVELFGTVGLLYIMFLAGLEIDLTEFKKNSGKSLIFGLLTFMIPMGLGIAAGYYLLNFPLLSAILLASMFASHTLIAYPIISKMGISQNKAVNISIGGTMITDTLALLVLAVVVGMSVGEVTQEFWYRLGVSVTVFALVIMIGFPILGRWFLKKYNDNVSQYIFVLALVFTGSFLAEAAGIEAIIGAFLAGLALNKLIPHTSGLMNRIEFVGNAMFIPFFLIGVGMLVDLKAFFTSWFTILVAVTMTVVALSSKYIAAWLTQKLFRFSDNERRVIFGLSAAQAAATLAVVLVAYKIILNQPEIDEAAAIGEIIEPLRLLGDSVLYGSILMILVTCTVASFEAQKGAQGVALDEAETDDEADSAERILVATNNYETTEETVALALIVKSKKNKEGLFALTIMEKDKEDGITEKEAKKILDHAVKTAAATDTKMEHLLRYDEGPVLGISNVVKEKKITDLIINLNTDKGISDSFLRNLNHGILKRSNITTMIYKTGQPTATLKRHLVFLPDQAEEELGFPFLLIRLWNLAKNTGSKLVFHGNETTLLLIKELHKKHPVEVEFKNFVKWSDFLIVAKDVQIDDNLIIFMSRKNNVSYSEDMMQIPRYLNEYFKDNNFLLCYPMQIGGLQEDTQSYMNPSVMEDVHSQLATLDKVGKTLLKIFKKNGNGKINSNS